MRIGLGHLGYSSEEFWNLSLSEFFCAIDGYLESKGVSKDQQVRPMTRDEMKKMFDRLKAEGKIDG